MGTALKRVVVFAPHSDDAELGLGGYMAQLRERNDTQVEVYVLAGGSKSSTKGRRHVGQEIRYTEGKCAQQVLGFHTLGFLEAAPDGAFNSVPRSQIVVEIEKVLNKGVNPDEIFIPLPSYHSDHVAAFEACISALRARNGANIGKRVFAYEYPGNSWGPQPPFNGRSYVGLSLEHFNAKVDALRCHGTQWVSSNQAPLIGLDAVDALASLRGSEIGQAYAEMFYVVREIR